MKNTIITASAGTGKTFALVTRLVRLLLLDENLKPSEIVALTFSRAAAGEIFTSLVERLAKGAASDDGAREVAAHVHDGLDPALSAAIDARCGSPVPRAVFAKILRDLIAAQHLCMIGTIDSFMLRVVRSFPLELGLQGDMAILDEHQAGREMERAVSRLFDAGNNTDALRDAFRLAFADKSEKSFDAALRDTIREHHAAFLDNPQEERWGNEKNIWPAGKPFHKHAPLETLANALREQLPRIEKNPRTWEEFCQQVRAFNGSFSDSPLSTFANNFFKDNPHKNLKLDATALQLQHDAIETLFALALENACMKTRGVHALMRAYESAYDAATRRRGRLVFDDIPRLIRGLHHATRQNIEYRFDTRFKHWALDEFQDTSLAQWDAIRNLLDEIIQSQEDGRSLFIVGDMKQAIYGWRAGDIRIFREQARLAREHGLYHTARLDASHRYGEKITALVNAVFDAGKINGFLKNDAPDAAAQWENLWKPHTTVKTHADSVFVARVEKFGRRREETIAAYASAIHARLLQLMEGELRAFGTPREPKIKCAILVRANNDGLDIAEYLRARGVNAVFEGEHSLSDDSPVAAALLHLLQCAEHPADTLAWQHVAMSPLPAALFKDIEFSPRNASEKILRDVARHGLPRALQSWVNALGPSDAFTRARLDNLVRAAFTFAATAPADASLSDFIAFVETTKQRESAAGADVRVLTIHRSKGLTFDHVLLPVIEPRGFASVQPPGLLSGAKNEWLLKPPADVVTNAEKGPVQAAAARAANDAVYESLCAWYVAFTRAKKSLSVFLHHEKSDKTPRLADLILECGDPAPLFLRFENNSLIKEKAVPGHRTPNFTRPPRKTPVQRIKPSDAESAKQPAAQLFSEGRPAAERGTEEHKKFQKITWLDEAPATENLPACLREPSPLRDALCKPVEKILDLWREHGFEILHNGKWISGAFDRVVFFDGRAEIYDFKTNRKKSAETDAQFASRMVSEYTPQMRAYRLALSLLCGLPESSIRAHPLLTETRACVPL